MIRSAFAHRIRAHRHSHSCGRRPGSRPGRGHARRFCPTAVPDAPRGVSSCAPTAARARSDCGGSTVCSRRAWGHRHRGDGPEQSPPGWTPPPARGDRRAALPRPGERSRPGHQADRDATTGRRTGADQPAEFDRPFPVDSLRADRLADGRSSTGRPVPDRNRTGRSPSDQAEAGQPPDDPVETDQPGTD
jgi:hypothetical protein